jgi:hypothetical protein
MCDVESRNIDPNVITVIYGGGELQGAIYKGFWLTITRDNCDIDEDGVANNSKLNAEYLELNPKPMRNRRTGFVPISPYTASFALIAEWIDETFE